jgi:hypothetical protein
MPVTPENPTANQGQDIQEHWESASVIWLETIRPLTCLRLAPEANFLFSVRTQCEIVAAEAGQSRSVVV